MNCIIPNQRYRLLKPLSSLRVGETYEIGNITECGNIILRDRTTKVAAAAVSADEFADYFALDENSPCSWTAWQPIMSRAGEAFFYRTNGKKVQVKCSDSRGEASCNTKYGDTFDLGFGIYLAYYDCEMRALRNQYDALYDQAEDVRIKLINLINERNRFVLNRYNDNSTKTN